MQNNMGELFGLMNLLDSEKYACEEEFLENFGGGKDGISLEQVQALQVCSCSAFNLAHARCAQPGVLPAIALEAAATGLGSDCLL